KGARGSSPGPDFAAAAFGPWLERVAHHSGRDIHVPRAMDDASCGVGGAVRIGVVQRVTREQVAVEPQERDVRREVPLEAEVDLRAEIVVAPLRLRAHARGKQTRVTALLLRGAGERRRTRARAV